MRKGRAVSKARLAKRSPKGVTPAVFFEALQAAAGPEPADIIGRRIS